VCHSNDRSQRVFGSKGGVEQIVLALKTFPDNAGLQMKVCAAMRYLSFDEMIRERLGQNSGVVCCVDAVRAVQINSEGLDDVHKALSNATFDHNENKLAVARCSGIAAVMSILTHDSRAVTLEGGLRVLQNLSDCLVEIGRSIREVGPRPTALDCLRSQNQEAGVVEHAIALPLNI
jgi:hypothetical protein